MADAPLRFRPEIVTVWPDAALKGEKPVMLELRLTMKKLLVVDVPWALVTETGPDVAPFGTTNEIWESESTV